MSVFFITSLILFSMSCVPNGSEHSAISSYRSFGRLNIKTDPSSVYVIRRNSNFAKTKGSDPLKSDSYSFNAHDFLEY